MGIQSLIVFLIIGAVVAGFCSVRYGHRHWRFDW